MLGECNSGPAGRLGTLAGSAPGRFLVGGLAGGSRHSEHCSEFGAQGSEFDQLRWHGRVFVLGPHANLGGAAPPKSAATVQIRVRSSLPSDPPSEPAPRPINLVTAPTRADPQVVHKGTLACPGPASGGLWRGSGNRPRSPSGGSPKRTAAIGASQSSDLDEREAVPRARLLMRRSRIRWSRADPASHVRPCCDTLLRTSGPFLRPPASRS